MGQVAQENKEKKEKYDKKILLCQTSTRRSETWEENYSV